MIDDAMSYFDSPDFMALPAETRIRCLDQVAAIARAFKAQALTEYIRRRWDGTVRWDYDRPVTGAAKGQLLPTPRRSSDRQAQPGRSRLGLNQPG